MWEALKALVKPAADASGVLDYDSVNVSEDTVDFETSGGYSVCVPLCRISDPTFVEFTRNFHGVFDAIRVGDGNSPVAILKRSLADNKVQALSMYPTQKLCEVLDEMREHIGEVGFTGGDIEPLRSVSNASFSALVIRPEFGPQFLKRWLTNIRTDWKAISFKHNTDVLVTVTATEARLYLFTPARHVVSALTLTDLLSRAPFIEALPYRGWEMTYV
jgi:hypothetical protein